VTISTLIGDSFSCEEIAPNRNPRPEGMTMNYLDHHRKVREQIIAREIMKLELRQGHERTRTYQMSRAVLRSHGVRAS
jgi:hypothetical protein